MPPERLLKSNPWHRFTWIQAPTKKIEQLKGEDLLKLLQQFRKAWPGVTAAESMLKVYVWSWARREEVAGLKWEDLRIVGDEFHFDTVGKWGVEKWFRIPWGRSRRIAHPANRQPVRLCEAHGPN